MCAAQAVRKHASQQGKADIECGRHRGRDKRRRRGHAQLLRQVSGQVGQNDVEANGVENRARKGNGQGLGILEDLTQRGFLRLILILKVGGLFRVAANPQAIQTQRQRNEEWYAPPPGIQGGIIEDSSQQCRNE